jgi:Ca2+/Na+ antiporter
MILIIFGNSLKQSGLNIGFLLVANAILFLITFLGFYVQTKGVRATNVNAFIRGVYSSLLIKMFVIVVAIVIYILVLGGKTDKLSILTAMGIYIIYTVVEVVQLMKIARKKPDA